MQCTIESLTQNQGYILTEREISRRFNRRIDDPIRLFSCSAFGINPKRFIQAVEPSFDCLEWDYYDVRRSIIAELLRHDRSLVDPEKLPDLKEYYLGARKLESLLSLLKPINQDVFQAINALVPCRKRAMSSYQFINNTDENHDVIELPMTEFTQDSVKDYREWPRLFCPMQLSPSTCPEFRAFLIGIGRMVVEVKPLATSMKLTVHQVSTVSYGGRPGSNSPEGIHQDGADFIVSAFVVTRSGIEGGLSRLFEPRRDAPFFTHTLLPGQGLFHADTPSQIWHDVTPIVHRVGASRSYGFRNSIGIDIYVDT